MSSKLKCVAGDRWIHPASRQVSLRLDGHTPVSAMRMLLSDNNALSDTLHELTHFHSLASPIGAVFSAWSFLFKLAADDLKARVLETRQGIDLSLARCLNFGMRMEQAEDEWRPFLEGMAIYAQTSAPCTYLDQTIQPLSTLRFLEVMVASLDPPVHMDAIMQPNSPMIEAGERVAQIGAGLKVAEAECLAEWVEFSSGEQSLPYFVGHAYVRALQAQLRRVTDDFDCAQTFLGLIFRILHGSWPQLLGRYGETIAYPKEAIGRLYGLMFDSFCEARPHEVQKLLEPDFDVDVLRWLELGQSVPPQRWGEDVLLQIINSWFSGAWNLLGHSEGSSDILPGALQVLVSQTQILNITSGGSCTVKGIVPSAEGQRHACALEVDGATWWLLSDDLALATLGIRPDDLVRLEKDVMRAGSCPPDDGRSITLQMDSFLFPRSHEIGGAGHSVWFLEVSLKGATGNAVIASVGPGSPRIGRAILHTKPKDSSPIEVRTELRSFLETPFDCAGISRFLERNKLTELAAATTENWHAHRARQVGRREKISRVVLRALLPSGQDSEIIIPRLIDDRMSCVLPDDPDIRNLLISAYASPTRLTGPGAKDTATYLKIINDISVEELGKPVFEITVHPDLGEIVRYLGIWERPS